MALLQEFVALFEVWEEALPYLHLMVDEQEMQFLAAMKGLETATEEAVSAEQVAGLLGLERQRAADLVQSCYQRCIVNKTQAGGTIRFSTADIGAVIDHFAKYGAWDDLPPEARTAIDCRFLDEFIAKHRANVERKLLGQETEALILPNDTVLLLHEVEEMIDAAELILVQPCDCRRLGQRCDLPVHTCIWLDAGAQEALDRGHGQPLGREEAKDLVRWADRTGLMHTADSEWQSRGLHAICNCCACDCYPFRAALELGSQRVWPRSRYIATYDEELCSFCGVCVERCHFAAFRHDDAGTKVLFDPHNCWGCGLCANTCPTGAIEMLASEPYVGAAA